ncbi:MAG: exodeoxyribonuclease VII large subunit, partial [Nitrospirae bacterium]|nr:exodeoxyribonuclease VII large subunit [Nitrospirota bacterium]
REEGLFDEGRKRPIPPLPRRIGIVTSPTGAALRDILNVSRRRFANVDVLVAPAAVQGERAVPEILEGIRDLNARDDVDVIILARGGGGIEDLWAFNDEAVARAVYHSRLPVISAVGHEIDFTIADFVADLRAPTPSAAAEMVIRNKEELERHLESLSLRMTGAVTSALDLRRTRLTALRRLLPKPLADLQRNFQRLDELEFRLQQGVGRLLREGRVMLEGLAKHLLLAGPAHRLADQRRRLAASEESLRRTIDHGLRIRRARMEGVISGLNTLSPLAILSRGYSVARKVPSLAVIRSAREVGWGDRIRVTLHEGELICRVEKSEGS